MYLYLYMLSSLILVSAYKPLKYVSRNKLRQTLFNIYNKKNIYDSTLEHIIPQSVYKKTDKILSRDLHNLILYPSKLNTHRSNFKYISDLKLYGDSKILDENGEVLKYINPIDNEISIKNSKKRLFMPKDEYKGDISRAAMYFIHTYPQYKDFILDEIIDPYTILTWHHQFPVSDFEKFKSKEISKEQGNENLFIKSPENLVSEMELILNKKLTIFYDYEY